jgi:hypothetical protein
MIGEQAAASILRSLSVLMVDVGAGPGPGLQFKLLSHLA